MKVYHQLGICCRLRSKVGAGSRTQQGSQIAEFAASLGMFVACILLPLLDFGIIPIRWMMAREVISNATREVSFCETFTRAVRKTAPDSDLAKALTHIGGVEIENLSTKLKISRVPAKAGDEIECITVAQPGQIPREWLPDGGKAPCVYMVEVNADLKMSPALAVDFSTVRIPGLSAPVSLHLNATRQWEHSGKDPTTGRFFINE